MASWLSYFQTSHVLLQVGKRFESAKPHPPFEVLQIKRNLEAGMVLGAEVEEGRELVGDAVGVEEGVAIDAVTEAELEVGDGGYEEVEGQRRCERVGECSTARGDRVVSRCSVRSPQLFVVESDNFVDNLVVDLCWEVAETLFRRARGCSGLRGS